MPFLPRVELLISYRKAARVWIVLFQTISACLYGQAGIEQDLVRAETMLVSYKNDSAYTLVHQIIENLKAQNQLNTPLGIPEATQPPAMSADDRNWLEAFEMYLRQNLSSDILSIPLLAEQFAMSESTLLRQLKRLTGLTPQKYLIEMRLDKARKLLENRAYNTVAQVACEVGYLDVKVFSRVFRQRFGKLPSEMLV